MGDSGFPNVCDMCSVPVANNFIHPQTGNDYGYQSFGELARFTYCLLQKIKQRSLLALVEQCEQYVLANHSKFPPICDDEFLSGTRVLAALTKIASLYLEKEFQRKVRNYLEEFTKSVLSTRAARSESGQGLSCFCPAVIIGWYFVGWVFGKGVDQRQRDRGLSV